MSDFEEQLSEALRSGAEEAPGAAGLARGARGRARTRRRRLAVAGGVAAVLTIAVPVAVVANGGGDGSRRSEGDPAAEATDAYDDILVSCGGDHSWPVSAMAEGVGSDVDDAAIREVFASLEAEMGIDAPRAIQEHGPDQAPYVVLAAEDDGLVLGVGEWTADGPQPGAQYLRLTRAGDDLEAEGWGDCTLVVALPAGRSRVEVSAPQGGVDPATTTPEVMVNEVQCASGREPSPYLGEPTVVETDDRVLVTLTSDPVVGGADCPSNPSVPLTLELDEPLGDRQLFDAGTWPPTPIRVAEDDGWQTIEHDGVRVEIPDTWREIECTQKDGNDLTFIVYGAASEDACGFRNYLGFYGSATFDPFESPGVISKRTADGDTTWGGYVYAGDEYAVSVATDQRALARRILDSARPRAR